MDRGDIVKPGTTISFSKFKCVFGALGHGEVEVLHKSYLAWVYFDELNLQKVTWICAQSELNKYNVIRENR